MNLSMNEAQGLVLKAGRGAALPLGHAADWASAVPWMDPSHWALLADGLERSPAMPTTQWQSKARIGACHAVIGAPLILDALQAGATSVECADLAASSLVGPLAAARGLVLSQNGDRFSRGTAAIPTPRSGVLSLTPDIIDRLQRLAHRTYVPENEHSRAAGAGAGLIDND